MHSTRGQLFYLCSTMAYRLGFGLGGIRSRQLRSDSIHGGCFALPRYALLPRLPVCLYAPQHLQRGS